MSYVGMATATGQVVDVPIVLRSLTASLAHIPITQLPIPFDLGFIATLEVGTNDQQFARVVNSYELDWWNGAEQPREIRYLTEHTLEQCLAHHRIRLLETMNGDPIPPKSIDVFPPIQIRPVGNADTSYPGVTDIPGIADDAPRADITCAHCDVYRTLAAELLEELKGVKNIISGLSASSSNDVEVATRRTAGFYTLHEKVILKEMSSDSLNIRGVGSKTQTKRLIRQVADNAEKELKRLQNSPSSYKWTWGETLTTGEVLDLQHTSNQRIHTGYQTSLMPGVLHGEYSATNTAPTGTAMFSSLPDPPILPPPTNLCYPRKLASYRINSSSPSNSIISNSARAGSVHDTGIPCSCSGDADSTGTERQPVSEVHGGAVAESAAKLAVTAANLWFGDASHNVESAVGDADSTSTERRPVSEVHGGAVANAAAKLAVTAANLWFGDASHNAESPVGDADSTGTERRPVSEVHGGADGLTAANDHEKSPGDAQRAANLWFDHASHNTGREDSAIGEAVMASKLWFGSAEGDEKSIDRDAVMAAKLWFGIEAAEKPHSADDHQAGQLEDTEIVEDNEEQGGEEDDEKDKDEDEDEDEDEEEEEEEEEEKEEEENDEEDDKGQEEDQEEEEVDADAQMAFDLWFDTAGTAAAAIAGEPRSRHRRYR